MSGVTASALAQMDLWQKNGINIEVSINISGYHLESNDFVGKLVHTLSKFPDRIFGKLKIEVLETVALKDINVVREIIGNCRELGITFALDDFGTGYSSLSYLSGLPVDELKIDQSFVRDMLDDTGDKAIVQGIIALAKAFGRQTVAEGIENDEQYQELLGMGCELGQGYLISKPLPVEQFDEVLKHEKENFRIGNQAYVMLRLNWHHSYECGDITIDNEHRKLFDLANTLMESAFARNENPKGFDQALEKLLAHVVKHFADEEAILSLNHYSDLDEHKAAHKALIDHAIQLRNSIAEGGINIGELVNFIAVTVVAQHMLKEDRKFYPLFAKGGFGQI